MVSEVIYCRFYLRLIGAVSFGCFVIAALNCIGFFLVIDKLRNLEF